MPLTTLHLTNAWHAASGGIRTFYSALLDAANRDGRRVIVVAPGNRDADERIGDFGRLRFIKAPPAPAFDRRYRVLYPHRYMPGVGTRLVRILEEEQPDVVEIADKYSLVYLAGMLRRGWFRHVTRPALVGLSCERFDDSMAAYLGDSHVGRRFTRWYLGHVYGPPFDLHLANSQYTADELLHAMPHRPEGFIQVCPAGVDVASFSPARGSRAVRAQLLRRVGGDSRTRLLLYAGRLSPEKNLHLLVATLRTLVSNDGEDFRLVVAGDGPQAAWLATQTEGPLAGRILLLGSLERDALAACYASCDVFVHPNGREPFGIGPLEAMASGVPTVLPDVGGVRTYANTDNAWLAHPLADSFADAIRAATRADTRRVSAARATAQAFNWADATTRYFAHYDTIHRQVHGGIETGRTRAVSTPEHVDVAMR